MNSQFEIKPVKMSQLLIVSDKPSQYEILASVLIDAGFKVSQCADFDQVNEYIESHKASLVIIDLDYTQTIVNGFDICTTIRRCFDLPIIMLATKAKNKERIKAFYLGADDFMSKPFSLPELILRILNLLKRSQPKNSHQPLISHRAV